MSRVPIALDRHGARRLAISCAKCDEPFHCGKCGAACILRQGPQRVYHFAHKAASGDTGATGCAGGGEGAIHEACKLFIKENIGNIVFTRACSECGEEVARWKGTGAVSEKDILANSARYRVDLLAHNETDSTQAVVEVLHTHRCSGDKLADLASMFGDHVYEVESFDYEEVTPNLPLVLSCVNRSRCASCVLRSEEEEAQQRIMFFRRRVEEKARETRRLQEERRWYRRGAASIFPFSCCVKRRRVDEQAGDASLLLEEQASEERQLREEQHQRAQEKARKSLQFAESRAGCEEKHKQKEAEKETDAKIMRATKKHNEAEFNCKCSDPAIRAWLQQGMPITCTSSGAYLSSRPSVYRCLKINPRRWTLCELCGPELAAALKQALRDEHGKKIAFPAFITAECVRDYLKEMRMQKPKTVALQISEDVSKRAGDKRKREV